MIESLVRGALKQRLVVAVIAAVLFFFGLDAARKLSVDAFPDVTNIQVQIATEAPGRSPCILRIKPSISGIRAVA